MTSTGSVLEASLLKNDEGEHDDEVAERKKEEKEAARTMKELSSPRGDNDDTPLEDMFADF